MSKDTTGYTGEYQFVSIGNLLSEKETTSAAIATAIEKEGVYTWDQFGRFILATDGPEDDPISKKYILDLVAAFYKSQFVEIYQDSTDEKNIHFIDRPLEEGILFDLNTFGWEPKALPDFDKLLKEAGQMGIPGRPEKGISSRADVYKIIKGLLILAFDEELPENIKKPKSNRISQVINKLHQVGVETGTKTIKRHLKKIPD